MPQFQFGLGRRIITPPIGIELCGYGPYRERKGTEVLRDLYTTALALSDGTDVFVWVSNDLIWVDDPLVDETYRLASQWCGIDAAHIVITNTHTHSGPATMRTVGWGEWDDAYCEFLPRSMAAAIVDAVDELQDGKIGFGRAEVPGLSVNRVDEDGPVDEEALLMRIDDSTGKVRVAVVNFSAHPVTLGSSTLICGDYVSEGISRIESALGPDAMALFLQGSCGNLNCRGFGSDVHTMRKNGELLQESVLPALLAIHTDSDVSLAGDSFDVALPTRAVDSATLESELAGIENDVATFDGDRQSTEFKTMVYERDWRLFRLELLKGPHPERLEIKVSFLLINDSVLVAHPLELFLEFGNAIRVSSPFARTFIVGYANGVVGYLARSQDFEQEGFGWYAAVAAPRLCRHLEFEKDAGDVFCNHIEALLLRARDKYPLRGI